MGTAVRTSWPVRRMARAGAGPVDDLVSALRAGGLDNAFNPSVIRHGETLLCAVRAYGPGGTKPFHAYLAAPDPAGGWTVRSLTDQARASGQEVVADPKLFAWAGRVFATFNTGTPSAGPNEILVMQVWPEPGPPRRCVLEPRQRIEKNWGFFEHHGRLRAIYSLAPLLLLDVTGEPDGDAPLTLRSAGAPVGDAPVRSLTIGPQPLVGDDPDLLRLVGHQKVYVGRRRAYVGRCVSVRLGPAPEVRVARSRLVHSWRDTATWRRPVHNPNLLSATYFSGLAAVGDDVLLSYGINDVDLGFARVGGDLWPR